MTKDLEMTGQIAVEVHKAGGRTFFVGGYVRDRIMGRENKDIDIEIHGIPFKTLQSILMGMGHPDERKVGDHFGILNLKGYDIDIAMPRRETPSTDSPGHKDFVIEVDPFIGYEKAARRRDFTINALMEDVITGEVLDYFGGLDDIRNRAIRHVDAQTFTDDPLRVFRAAQFAARFRFYIAEDTRELLRAIPTDKLSHERVAGELDKALLKADMPAAFFDELRKVDQLKTWFPEVEALIGVQQDPAHHPEGDVYNHTMLVLNEAAKLKSKATDPRSFMAAALCHDFGKSATAAFHEEKGRWQALGHDEAGAPMARDFIHRIWHEKKIGSYVADMTLRHMKPLMMVNSGSSKKKFMHLFDDSVCPEDLILLAKADNDGRLGYRDFSQAEGILRQHLADYRAIMAEPYIQGKDLTEAGYKPGPKFTEMLDCAHKMRLAGVDRETAMKQIQGTFGRPKLETHTKAIAEENDLDAFARAVNDIGGLKGQEL